jgi:hypothetical protein
MKPVRDSLQVDLPTRIPPAGAIGNLLQLASIEVFLRRVTVIHITKIAARIADSSRVCAGLCASRGRH